MKILICLSALLCNLVSLKLHTNVKRWVSFGLPVYMRSNFSLRFFLFLSLGIGMLILALISDVITEANTRFHMFFLGNKPWGVYIWGLTILSFVLAIYGYNLE